LHYGSALAAAHVNSVFVFLPVEAVPARLVVGANEREDAGQFENIPKRVPGGGVQVFMYGWYSGSYWLLRAMT